MLIVQVFLFKDGQFLGTEMASGENLEIGRDPRCDIVLDDPNISRRHAVLFPLAGGIAIQDGGSATGTTVNGERVTQPTVIGARDDVGIGRFALKLKHMNAPQEAQFGEVPATRLAPEGSNLPSEELPATALAKTPAIGAGDDDEDETVVDEGRLREALARARQPSGEGKAAAKPAPVAPQPIELSSAPPGEAPFLDEQTLAIDDPRVAPPAVESTMPTGYDPEATDVRHRPPAAPFSDEDSQPVAEPVIPQPPAAVPQPMAAKAPEPAPARAPAPASSSSALEAELGMAIPDVVDDLPAITFEPSGDFFDEDEDDDVYDGPPLWSLVQTLVRAEPEPKPPKGGTPLVEVIHYQGERIVDHAELTEGQTFRFGRRLTKEARIDRGMKRPVALVSHKKGHVAEVKLADGVRGQLLRDGQQVDISQAAGGSGKKVPLAASDMASLDLYGDRVFVRLGHRPDLVGSAEQRADEKSRRKLWLSSFGSGGVTWLLIGVVAWIAQYRSLQETVIQLEDDGFAEVIEEKEVEMELPEPEEPEPMPEEEIVPEEQPKQPEQKVEPQPKEKPAPTKRGVLDVLDKVPTSKKGGNQNLTAAMSNIKSVRVPGASGFKTSGLIGKGPKGVQIGGAAGGPDTSSLASILKKGGGGTGKLGGKQTRKVKGRVKQLKRSYKKKGQGSIDKAAVLRVIQSHIGEIQYCYEKQLRVQSGLSGRVQLEWTINTDGRVSIVKNKQSTLKSAAAITCMMGKVKTWKFPKPTGGSVIISFPFVFNTL